MCNFVVRTINHRLALLAFLVLAMPSTYADVIFEDDFNADAVGIPTSSLLNWNIDSPSIDVVGGSTFGYLCNGNTGGNCLDTEGTPGNGQITTKVGLDLGLGDYTFSFDFGNNGTANNSLAWNIGSIIDGVIFSGAAQENIYENFSIDFSITSAATGVFISFAGGGASDFLGTILDNVLLVQNSSSVPEPETLLLLALGLLGLGLRKKKGALIT